MPLNYDDWMRQAGDALQRGNALEMRSLLGNRPHPTIERAALARNGDIQTQCIFCHLFAELSGIPSWNGPCPACKGTGMVSIATYFVMLDAYMEDLALAERDQAALEAAEDFTIPLIERPSFPPIRCPNPECQQGSVLTDGKGPNGSVIAIWVNCATCHGRGYIGEHPTAQPTLQEVPCVYCMYDVDDSGDTFEDRKNRCTVCRGIGTKSRSFYQRLLAVFSETPTRAPNGPTSDPLIIHGTLTLREALNLQHGAVTTLTLRPARIFVCRNAEARSYRVLTESISASFGAQRIVICRDKPFRYCERYLAEEVKHIEPRSWRPFDPDHVAVGGL